MKKAENFTEKLMKTIQNDIISGKMQPGDRLPPLREIAQSHSVSRSVVNSAISALSAKGYLKVNPRHFVVVNDYLRFGSLSILEDIFHGDNPVLRLKMIKDTLNCRRMVETEALRQAASRSDCDLSRLQDIVKKERSWLNDPSHQPEDLPLLDLDFHDSLIRLGDNMVTMMMYHTFHYLARPMVSLFYERPSVIPFVFDRHSLILDALVMRDFAKAENHLRELLAHGEREILPML